MSGAVLVAISVLTLRTCAMVNTIAQISQTKDINWDPLGPLAVSVYIHIPYSIRAVKDQNKL